MLFDSHVHLDDEKFNDDREEVIARAQKNGVSWMINPGDSMASSARAIALAEQHEAIYAAVGVHPHEAAAVEEGDYERLAAWTKQPKVVAIGEIGLDYYYDLSPREVQQKVMIRQLDVARQTGMPVIIHDRDAHGDIVEILKKEGKGLQGVFHCFSGSWEMARIVLGLGFYLAVGGSLTFKNAAKLPAVVTAVPLERLLLETDCPYLTPRPYRGRRNEPAYVRLVAEEVARLRHMELSGLAEATTGNVRRLFSINK